LTAWQVPFWHKLEVHCWLTEQLDPGGRLIAAQRLLMHRFDVHCWFTEQVAPVG